MTSWKLPVHRFKIIPSRFLVAITLPIFFGACASSPMETRNEPARLANLEAAPIYGELDDNGKVVPAVNVAEIDGRNLRQMVSYDTRELPGTVVVDPQARFLYLVMPEGKAMRYGVGVARAGLAFEGRAVVGRKAVWPGWTPTSDMIRREPKRYGPYANGLKGGLSNPLGARALYLYQNGADTAYRIHGTNEPLSIGHRVSSGCIRMFNQDIIDLFSRVPTGSRVVVLGMGADEDFDLDLTDGAAGKPRAPDEM